MTQRRAVHMSKAQAEQLIGRTRGEGEGIAATSPPRVRARQTAGGRYHTVCFDCDLHFHTRASEDRHVKQTGHARYQLVLGFT